MKKICAITMARNDDFFLSRWIEYYGRELGNENLYIYLDGEDQPIPPNAENVNVFHQKRIPEHVVKAEKKRLKFLSEVAADLLQKYDMVIGVDADEFVVVDPQTGKSLQSYLSSIPDHYSSISGLGLDVGQRLDLESTLDYTQLFLNQRQYALLSSRYTKTSIITKPVKWGSGFHRIKNHNYNIDPNLYLFHFGSVDLEMVRQRFQDKDRMSTGRGKHIKKRVRTIDVISKGRILSDERWLFFARTVQKIIRPVYALNKPSMAGLKLTFKIPDRFQGIC